MCDRAMWQHQIVIWKPDAKIFEETDTVLEKQLSVNMNNNPA